jgi:glycosyltransferase involved in cell wall biosynthesis
LAQPPKVLHIVGGSKYGGGAQVILSLAKVALSAGFEVDVLIAKNRAFAQQLRSEGVGVIDLDVIRRSIRPIWDTVGLIRLYRFIASSDYSIVHTHTSKAGFVGRLAAHWARVPVIVHTVHGFAFHDFSRSLAVFSYRILERLAARWCDRIVTVSEHHRDVALRMKIGTADTVLAIPNGIPPDRVRHSQSTDETRMQLDIHPEDIVLLSMGRLAEQKGLSYLIQGVGLLSRTVPNLRLLLAGEGDLRTQLEEEVHRLGLADRVSFLGLRMDVGNLLAACDIVTLPSLWEGLSIALLEAMAAAKPIVTTNIASNLEVTDGGTCAILVAPAAPDELATAIDRLIGDAQMRDELGRRGAEVFMSRYTEERMVVAYLAMYRDLAARKGVPIPS